jgi:hypothetical protein
MTKLIALAVIAAGVIAADSAEIPEGTAFEVAPEVAEPLLTQGLAKLADTPLAPTPKPKTVKVRVLVACSHGQPDDVISLPADVAKLAEEGGQVDSNKAAVAYAMSLQDPT